jgi:hypothetical protein
VYWISCCPQADQILLQLVAPYKRLGWRDIRRYNLRDDERTHHRHGVYNKHLRVC